MKCERCAIRRFDELRKAGCGEQAPCAEVHPPAPSPPATGPAPAKAASSLAPPTLPAERLAH